MAAPAIRTNIPEWKNLFAWLKQLGVNKIYDVSLGADICIWGYIRYIEQNPSAPVITQPCPVIVSYCEKYRQNLLKRLSPVHSPMACCSIYMKEYEGITDRIAAFSPCIAKTNEFADTGLAQYNITFAMLVDYIEKNKIKLPKKQAGFDHNESGLGSIFPMPGGLMENINFFTEKKLSIDKAEGITVYKALDTYAESPAELLPQVFDVLNCHNGCNVGTACTHAGNIFRINREMDGRRKAATENYDKDYFDDLYKKYDERFSLPLFLRVYNPVDIALPSLSDEDIENAYALLDKTDDEMKHVDCGACGSDTCYGMARKIALGVNIPVNCIVKAMNDAKAEHVKNIAAQEQLDLMEKMRTADDRMRVMLDSTPLGAHFWDEDMNIVDCNLAAARLFNMNDKQEYIKRYFDLTPEFQPDGALSRDKLRHVIEKARKEGSTRLEWMRQTLDGESIPVELTLVSVAHQDKNLVAGYCRDIREHKRMLQELDHTASQLASALEKAETAVRSSESAQITTAAMFGANPQMNVLFNQHFKAVDCNPAAVNFMGFDNKKEALKGFLERLAHNMPVFQSNGHPSVSIGEKLTAASKKGHAKFETEVILDGETRTVAVQLIRIPYENGTGVVAYLIDMTDVHEREKELTHARELNELQLAKLDLVVKASKIGLWDMQIVRDDPVNPNNKFMWSDEFRHMVGYTDESDFPNILSSWSDKLHPEDKERTLQAFANHMLDITGQTPYDVEYRLKKKNGDYAYYRASGETIRDEKGNPLRVAGALIDVTETKNILLDSQKQKLEAEAANQAKSSFLSTMSHEIRTPMNAILGITEIQLQNEYLDPGVREGFEKIYTSGDMLLSIINDILDLSKIEAGKFELISDRYEIASMVSDTAQLNMMRIGSKTIAFELNVDENMPADLEGDELRVKQILNNLLSNAFKYTSSGTVTLNVYAEDIPGNIDDVYLVVSVSDTGQGMSKEQVATLFDEYSRFNMQTNRSTEGTGLGMSITNNLLKMMNGDISVQSEPGIGSTFTVRLLQRRCNNAVLGEEMARNLHQFRSHSRAQLRRAQITREPMPYGSVLIVDDVETNIYVAQGLMTPYELYIDTADSGYAAIEKIKAGKVYDIIFMDHMMPKLDGVETAKILRGMGYYQPIVALTANAVGGQSDIFLANGFDDFVSKPIDIRQLNIILNKFIRDKQTPEVIEAARQQAIVKKGYTYESNASRPAFIDPQFAEIFARDALKSLAVLERIIAKGSPYTEEDLRIFTIHVHGMKSALANVKKMDLSAVAMKLEESGREGDAHVIATEAPSFITALRAFVEEIMPKEKKGEAIDASEEDSAFLREKLLVVKTACEDYNESPADNALKELRGKKWSQATKDLLAALSEYLLHSDFDEIVEAINKILND